MAEQGKTDDPAGREWRRRRRRRVGWLLAVVVVVTAGSQVPWRRWFPNFGVVAPGKVYRSAQPEGRLEALVRERKLASVLNLRAGSMADPFYAEEVHVTGKLGVDFYDFPMSASRRPSRRELLTLLDLFRRCRYPLLIHCKSGADRTGLASALYRLAEAGEPPEEAARAFALRYGHVPIAGTEHLHEPLNEYAAWLAARGLAHTPDRFRDWVANAYPDDAPARAFRPLRPGPRAEIAARRAGRPVR